VRKRYTTITTTIEKLIFGGQGLASHNGKKTFIWNALPGEKVDALIYKRKRHYLEAVATHIHTPSPDRIAPLEDHHLSCSPWQILSSEKEMEWKQGIASEMFAHAGILANNVNIDVYNDLENQYNYRNKMEFSFCKNEDGAISLAFYKRGRHNKLAIPHCCLATTEINRAANYICDWLTQHRFPIRTLKSLIIRSNNKGEVIAALFLKDMISVLKKPQLKEGLKGFHIFFSSPQSPASRPDKLLSTEGDMTLCADVYDKKLMFGLLSFFQINYSAYIAVLEDLKKFLNPERDLVDFYSGVGALSLPLRNYYKTCRAVELNEEAVQFARDNISLNSIENYEIHQASTEKALDFITADATILFDPPRSGLHKKIISRLLEVKPERIIYLSCNVSTQTRDLQLLLDHYDPVFLKLFNFFPRTPHIESLCALEKKSIET